MSDDPSAHSAPERRLITVDGPAGSGKSTLGRRLAQQLRLAFLDTGLFYRGLTVAAVRAGTAVDDAAAMGALARGTRIELQTDPTLEPGKAEVLVDGDDVSALLRDPRHATLLSRISAIPEVRHALLAPQRALAVHGAVAVGRDCGTVVFPEAPVKFFLWAATETRMRRRALQLSGITSEVHGDALQADVSGRDTIDSTRAAAPLRPAPDAHLIDTDALDVDAMVVEALAICAAAGLLPP